MTAATVVLTCHDDVSRAPRALAGLSALTGGDLQLVVVDDASTDGTADLVAAWVTGEPRAELVQLPVNGGVAAARRAGLDVARGEYVWFVDSDDAWSADAVRRLVDAARHHDADVVACGAEYVDDATGARRAVPLAGPPVTTGADAFAALCRGRWRGHLWNKLIRRSLLAGVEFPAMRVHSDLAVSLQAVALARRVAVLDEPLYEYHVRPGSLITVRRNRRDSLVALARVFDGAVRRNPSLATPGEQEYFLTRFVGLSPWWEHATGATTVRPEVARPIRPAGVVACLRVGDRGRAVAAAVVLVHPRLLGVLLRSGRVLRTRRRGRAGSVLAPSA